MIIELCVSIVTYGLPTTNFFFLSSSSTSLITKIHIIIQQHSISKKEIQQQKLVTLPNTLDNKLKTLKETNNITVIPA